MTAAGLSRAQFKPVGFRDGSDQSERLKKNMAILEIIDNLDNVPEEEKSNWTEVDGKFQRDVEMPDVSGLKSALQKERDAAKKAAEDLARFKDIDPEKYAEMVKAHEAGLTDKERYENSLKKRDAEIAKIKSDSEAKVKDLEDKLRKFHLDKEARKAALDAGVIPGDIDDVLLLTAKNRRLDDDGNIIVVDDDGDPTAKSLTDFYSKDFKESKPKYFPGIPGGGGTPPGGHHKGNVDYSKMTPKERLDHSRGVKV